MNLGLEAKTHISESAWSAWMQTYQILTYRTDELCSQNSFFSTSIQQNPGISLKEGQLKGYACQVYGPLKYVCYYEYRFLYQNYQNTLEMSKPTINYHPHKQMIHKQFRVYRFK